MTFIDKILYEYDQTILNKSFKNPATNRSIKVSSALNYPDSDPVKKKALGMLKRAEKRSKDSGQEISQKQPSEKIAASTVKKNERSHKPKSNKYGISKECVEFLKEKGLKGLNAYPQSFVKPEEIQFNPALNDSNKNSIWVVKFPVILPNGNKAFKTAYTAGFMKKSQVKKYKKISKIKEEDITNLDVKTDKLIQHKDKEISDSACVLKIILKTGLRIGSKDEAESGNIGIRTLKAENIKISGNKVSLNFIGKSYQENSAEIDDPTIASYLKKNLEGKSGKDSVFDCSYQTVGNVMRKINPKGINPKDLRTYKATQYAKELLQSKFAAPPPLPNDQKEIKKLVKDKLKLVFEKVSAMLSNSPGMAKNSYVHPVVITDYLNNLGLTPQYVGYKHVTLESKSKIGQFTTMDQMFSKYKDYGNNVDTSDISDEDSNECEEFLLPEWFYSDEWDLVRK